MWWRQPSMGGTDSVVLCHNHPNGVALPSREDLMATENIVRALGLVKVHLRDHIILTESEYFSMREANRLPFYRISRPGRCSGRIDIIK